MRTVVAIVALSTLLAACESAGDPLVAIDATGSVAGSVFVDRDGDGEIGSGDAPLPGVDIRLFAGSGSATVATARTDASGSFVIPSVPVGRYRIVVDEASVPDSLQVVGVDNFMVTVAAADTAEIVVQTSYPTVTVVEARALPAGRRAFVRGILTSGWGTFGDSTVHIRDAGAALRGVRVDPSGAVVGDSVRLLGTRSSRDGQPTVSLVRVFVIRPGDAPLPVALSTAAAATASAGALDADLVRVMNGAVRERTALPGGDERIVIDDGSGRLDVLVDRRSSVRVTLPPADSLGVIPAALDVTGVLVPRGDGSWRIQPRVTSDVTVRPASGS